jgi:hypothetical protein
MPADADDAHILRARGNDDARAGGFVDTACVFRPWSGVAATLSSAASASCRRRFQRSIGSWPAEARRQAGLGSMT